EFGHRRLGPVNESYYRRLERYLQVARKNKRGVQEAERNLRLAPQLYGFPQEVVLYDAEPSSSVRTSEGSTEAMRHPHWRHGHWKMQAYGPGCSQHKRIFIKPVFVNGHLMRDGAIIPQTTYRIRKSRRPKRSCPNTSAFGQGTATPLSSTVQIVSAYGLPA